MKRSLLTVLALATASLAGCSVGTYNIPDVAPVVMPEPEEDMFADVDFGGGSSEGAAQPAADKPAESPPAEPPVEAAPADPAPPPAKKK